MESTDEVLVENEASAAAQFELEKNASEIAIIAAKNKITLAKEQVVTAQNAIQLSLKGVVTAEEALKQAQGELTLLVESFVKYL